MKVYDEVKEQQDDGTWQHKRITLRPASTDRKFKPVVLENLAEGELEIIAELLEVLTSTCSSTT